MGDIKTPWTNPGAPTPGIEGEAIAARGTDPNVMLGSGPGLQEVWSAKPVPTPGGEETANSVSGLPAQPSRMVEAPSSMEPPSLKDRMPGTIDER